MLRLNFQRIPMYTYFVGLASLRTTCQPETLRRMMPTAPATAACSIWKRLVSQYQFRTQKPVYYPDRQAEMKYQRSTPSIKVKSPTMQQLQQQQQQLANKTGKMLQNRMQHRGLPKDYYYKVLGVHKHATIQQIRSAFYALAKRYHPDSTHSEQKLQHFQELSNAYNILTDETKRLEYDQLGSIKDEQAFLAQAGNPMQMDPETAKKYERQKSNDEIQKLTGNEFDLSLSFVDATVGCKKRLDLRYLRKCDTCKGKSQLMAHREVGKEPCRRCNGTGKVTTKTVTFTSVNTCSQCKGKRFINRNDCETCDNRGYVVANVEVLITVPSGSKSGDVITIDNPNTKQRVNYRLDVPPSEYFRRIGNDIHTDKHLTISEAILGGNFTARGLYENVELRIEPGTQSETQIVLKNKGVRSQDGIGNHIITLKVRIPRNLSVKQRQLVLALAQAEEPLFERHQDVLASAIKME
ncbi:chaperone protein DnaJ isoform X1 [Drosophila tropicalis]|uniref:chaperone protein DnaJ isoform X1 n=1 Tax=Drosophila tropicalis TaxID=46794 RepID=UPI0035ABE89C